MLLTLTLTPPTCTTEQRQKHFDDNPPLLAPPSSSPAPPQRPSSSGGGGWEAVESFGDGAVSTPVGETSLCEELALDAAGCVVADSIVERPRGWTILRPLLASLDRAAVQRVGPDRGGLEWQRVVSRVGQAAGVPCVFMHVCPGLVCVRTTAAFGLGSFVKG